MVEITFIGLCLFVQYAGVPGRTVVIPDFSSSTSVMTPRGPTCIEPHLAYIEADKDDVASCDACELHDGRTMVMFLGGDQLEITGSSDSKFELGDVSVQVPSITKNCPGFRLVQPLPPSATRLQIDKGTLSTRKMKDPGGADTDERITALTLSTADAITFEATHGGVTRKMVLKAPGRPSQRVSIVNRGATGFRGQNALAANHWLAFYSLSATPVVCDLPIAGAAGQTTIACSNSNLP
jgi:hypothetical protein